MAKEKQSSFAGGEFAPTMQGRSDLAQFDTGCKTLKNFFVDPDGSLANRAGTVHVDGLVTPGEALLAPFVFSDDDALLLVFTADRFSVYRGDTLLIRYSSPYAVADFDSLDFAQIGNVITIASPNYPPHELRRLTADGLTWSLTEIDYSAPDFPSHGGIPRLNRTDYNYFSAGDSGVSLRMYQKRPDTGGDSDHIPREWQWQITRIMRDSDGALYETTPFTIGERVTFGFLQYDARTPYWPNAVVSIKQSGGYGFLVRTTAGNVIGDNPLGSDWTSVTAGWPAVLAEEVSGYPSIEAKPKLVENLPSKIAIAPDWVQQLTWADNFSIAGFADETPAATADDDEIVSTRIYRGREGLFGFIGESTGDTFEDIGAEPDYSKGPPTGEASLRDEYPATVTFFEGRRIFAGTTERPGTLFGSASGDFRDFDLRLPSDAADSFEFELASNRLERIRALIPRRRLIVMTTSAEWEIQGSDGAVLTPLGVQAHPVSDHGSADIPPIEAQGIVFFLQSKGTVPKALIFSSDDGGFRPINISRFSSHMFRGHTIVSWAYAEDPYSILWAVRDDGVLLSLTFSREDQMAAWATHEIAGGLVERVATIPNGTEDDVYIIVNRDGTRNLERMASRNITDIRDGVFTDSSVQIKRDYTQGTIELVTQSADVDVDGDDVIDVGDHGGEAIQVKFYDANGVLVAAPGNVGQFYQVEDADGLIGQIQITAAAGGGLMDAIAWNPVLPLSWRTEATSKLAYTELFQVASGLDHLIGESVMALLDGAVAGPFAVTTGSLNFGTFHADISIGLAYDCDFESLDTKQDRTKRKLTRQVSIETLGRGGQAGTSLDGKLYDIIDRDAADDYGAVPIRREERVIQVSDSWAERGGVALRLSDPLPLTILGLTRDVVTEGWK